MCIIKSDKVITVKVSGLEEVISNYAVNKITDELKEILINKYNLVESDNINPLDSVLILL